MESYSLYGFSRSKENLTLGTRFDTGAEPMLNGPGTQNLSFFLPKECG